MNELELYCSFESRVLEREREREIYVRCIHILLFLLYIEWYLDVVVFVVVRVRSSL